MAPIKLIKVTPQTKPQPPTPAAHGSGAPQAPTRAPSLRPPTTGEGERPKTAPTFDSSPALKPAPKSNQVKIVQPDRHPGPRGPQAPLGGTSYGNQQQPIDK